MHIATIQDLFGADDQEHIEAPPGFDWEAAMQEVAALREPLSKHTGLVFEQDMHVQDASFFTELVVVEPPVNNVTYTVVGVRFSAFARFFMVWGNSSFQPLTAELRQDIVRFVCAHDFIFVPPELLAQRYHDPKLCDDWGTRYFDYL